MCCLFVVLFFFVIFVGGGNVYVVGGLFGIDYCLYYDNSGIWNCNNQKVLMYGSIFIVGVGVFVLGDDSKLGDMFWCLVDLMVIIGVVVIGMKYIFCCECLLQIVSFNQWFKSFKVQSFFSGEVVVIFVVVMLFIVNYGQDYFVVYVLVLLFVYDVVVCMKVCGYWQSDVLVGVVLGIGIGIWLV